MPDSFFPPVVLTFVASTAEASGQLVKLAESFEQTGKAAVASMREAGASAAATGERVTAADAEIAAANERALASFAQLSAQADRSAEQMYVSMAGMAAKNQAALAELEAAEARAAAATKAFGDTMDETAVKGAAAAEKWKAIRTGALILGAGALVVGGEFVHMAADFETATTTLVTSAGESHDQLDMVRQGMLDLAGQVGYSTDALAKAMYTVESGGQHGANGLTVLKAAAQGAKAENAELHTVADAVTSVLQDYHLKADQAANVTSKLVAATSVGKTTFEQLAGSLSAILPIASSAHVSLDDILGDLASMTVHGMSAQQATQNMADAVRHMLAPTQVQAKELGQLGLSAQDLAGMLGDKGLSGTVQFLSETILQHMGPSGKVMLDAFNQSKDAAGAVKTMIANMPPQVQTLAKAYMDGSMSLKDWSKEAKNLPTDQAELAKQFQTMADRARGFSDILKSGSPTAQSYQDALRRVMGDATGLNVALMLTGENTDYVNQSIHTVSDAAADASGNVKGWSDVQSTFNQKLAAAKGGAEALGISIGQRLLPVASRVMEIFAQGAGWLARHQGAATTLAIVLGGALVIGLAAATAAAWSFTVALLANPATWIVLGIMALVAAIVLLATHWDQVWNAIKTLAGTVWAWLDSNVFGPIKAIFHVLGDVVSVFGKVWADIWNGIGDVCMWVWNHTIGWVIDQIKHGIQLAHDFTNAITSIGGGGAGIGISTAFHAFGFDDGGWVPGSPGQPQLSVVHGGEYVLSRDMLAGRKQPDLTAALAMSGARTAEPLRVSPTSGGGAGNTVVIVNVAGTVLAERDLQRLMQQTALRYNLRNTGNGLSVAGA